MTMPPSPSRGRIIFFLILTTVFWGGSFLFTKIGARDLPPAIFVLLRFSLASLLMLALCLPRLGRLDRTTILRGAIVGTALGVTNLTFVVGIKGTSISRAGVLNNLFVLFIPLIARILWKERIGPSHLAGILMASGGIALLAAGGGQGFNRGDLISTLCAFFIAVHIITVSKVLKDDDVWLISLVQFSVVALMAGSTVALQQPAAIKVSREALFAIAYCAVFSTVICFTLQNTYQRYVTPTQAGLIYTLDPVWSLLAGFGVLGERLAPREWLGCGLIFLAVVVPLAIRYLQERRLLQRYRPAG
ncbi:Permease of the drug/metabolite transporter (DMT) superfamily [Trichlorobacter ammonificans]|uniref:Permease of the drug/metabolite transporter (DMT) superfamily n=2 Tax=Trichlorobacter ammonificans TaxID=2916410 RepID=A0ABM9DA15_9BACT|nr:Permease of the drug/metabolite transporter (DMT) superfamily [Trichlorobacter ammonificans]